MFQKNFFALATLIAGASLCLISWQSMSANTPKVWAPFSIIFVILYVSGLPTLFIIFFATVFMWGWNPLAFTGKVDVPKRSFILFLILAMLSAWHNIVGWSYGMKYQGEFHTAVVTVANFGLLATLFLIAFLAWRKPTFTVSLTFHWLLFGWLVSYAFPYLGELP